MNEAFWIFDLRFWIYDFGLGDWGLGDYFLWLFSVCVCAIIFARSGNNSGISPTNYNVIE